MNFLNRIKSARQSHLLSILIVGIVLMFNYIASQHFFRVDLTQQQLFAVADSSKEIMRNLDDVVSVKVYFSEKLPPQLFQVRQYLDDMLEELDSYSGGNLRVEFLNPADPKVAQEALGFGIPRVRMNIVEKDKLEVKKGFLGAAVIYGDKLEILPIIQNHSNIEYDLVAAIKKVTASEPVRLAFLTGHGEPTLEEHIGIDPLVDSFGILKQALDRNYDTQLVNLEQGDSLEGYNALLIAGSKTAFSEKEQYAIDQYLLTGGNIIAFLDAIEVSNSLAATVIDLGLDDFLKHYGVQIEKKFVMDRLNETATFNQGVLSFDIAYPFWVKAVNENFDPINPVVSQLDSFVLPWASPLQAFPKEGITPIALALSSPDAWVQEEPFVLDPGLIQNEPSKSQYPLAAFIEGRHESYFNGHELAEAAGEDHLTASTETGRLLVVGNSRFISDRYLIQFSQNLVFAMNAIDYLSLDDSLISIRSKTVIDRPLNELTIQQRSTMKWIGLFLMPLVVVLLGIARYIQRKRKTYVLSEKKFL